MDWLVYTAGAVFVFICGFCCGREVTSVITETKFDELLIEYEFLSHQYEEMNKEWYKQCSRLENRLAKYEKSETDVRKK